MLQIKNTLGGGKPEGLYAWKKSSVACIDNITTQTGKNYTLGNATSDTTVYYSTSYTLDETTGTYTLVNPKSATLQYAQWGVYSVEMVKSNYYIWGSTSSNEIYNTNANSTYTVYLKNSDGKVFLESDSANYKYDIHSAKIEYTFLDYIVSDKETAYPDGGEKGGYWYERVVEGITPEMFGCTKMAVDEFTVTSRTQITYSSSFNVSHSLGVVPTFALIYLEGHTPETNGDLVELFKRTISSTSTRYILTSSGGTLTLLNSSDYSNIKYTTSTELKLAAGINNSSYFKYLSPGKYKVITMA